MNEFSRPLGKTFIFLLVLALQSLLGASTSLAPTSVLTTYCSPGIKDSTCSWLGTCSEDGSECICDEQPHRSSEDRCLEWHEAPTPAPSIPGTTLTPTVSAHPTPTPTLDPTTSVPSVNPPSIAPSSSSPTLVPTSSSPTSCPSSSIPTYSAEPTSIPSTSAPSAIPSSSLPSSIPSSSAPSYSCAPSSVPTLAPTSPVTLDEKFDDLEMWQYDIAGETAHVSLVPNSDATGNLFSANLSYCASCFRAEIATKVSERGAIIPSDNGVVWFGITMRVPEDWEWKGTAIDSDRDVTYFMQMHSGDVKGYSPNVGLRSAGDKFTMNVCGFETVNATDESCMYLSLGKVEPGEWVDWVVELNMVAFNLSGYVNVWRNGEQVVGKTGIATSFNSPDPPYTKIGVYQLNWKGSTADSLNYQPYAETLTQYWAFDFQRVKVAYGDLTSYEDVYTGTGEPCGDACEEVDDDETDDSENEKKKKDDDDNFLNNIDLEVFMMAAIPILCIAVCVCMFYFANQAIDRKYESDPAYANQREIELKSSSPSYADVEGGRTSRTSRQRASTILAKQEGITRSSFILTVNAVRDTFVWVEEEDFVHDSSFVWEEPWQATMKRKVFWYIFGYGSVLGMILFSMVLYGNPVTDQDGLLPWTKVHEWTVGDVATYMTVTFVYTATFFLPLAFLPQRIDEGKKWKNDPNFLKRIGVVIPCHKSADEIGKVLQQVLKYIPPENVCVCDNGNFNWPADDTYEVCKSVHPLIQYCFISQGHKTRALWTGCNRLPKHCEYIVHLDDDTWLSDHMVFDEAHFKTDGGQHVSAVGFLRSSHRENLLTNFTDFWYKITDHFHATQAKIATRCFVPGPAGMWRRDRFKEVFGAHPALPFGEDIFGGFTTLNMGYAIRAETRCMVTTFAPDVLVNFSTGGRVQGYGASSLWKQRAHRWTVSALRITGKSLYSFFTYDTKGGILSNIAFRMYRFREYKIIFVQVMYIPFCVVILARGFYIEFFLLKFMLFIWPLLRNIYINYFCWRNSPQLKVKLQTVLLSPFFNFFLIMCAVHGRLKCLLWYIPNVPPNHGMLQRCHPRPRKTIKVLESTLTHLGGETMRRPSMAQPDFEGTNPLRKDSTGSSIPTAPGADNDLFEFFYRDGNSAYVSYSSGGIDEEHTRKSIMGEKRRKSSVVQRKQSGGAEFETLEEETDDIEAGADGDYDDDRHESGDDDNGSREVQVAENTESVAL